jgi:aminoglycoside phosphotransferase (APT) family kinase protein
MPPEPAAAPAQSEGRRLAGHSGAVVTLLREQGRSFVRKRAGSAAQNARLAAQCEKQRAWHASGQPCPAILREGLAGGLYFFDMDYVAGSSAAHQCISGARLDRAFVARELHDLLARLHRTSGAEIPPADILGKLAAIGQAARGNPALAGILPGFLSSLDRLAGQDWRGVPQSEHHGDLTLENLIIHQTDYWLIDFDVVDIGSWFMDVGKLFQDLHGQWCLRHLAAAQPGSLAHLNAQLALSRLGEVVWAALRDLSPRLPALIPALAAFSLARAMPYCTDAATAAFLAGRVEAVLDWEV